MERAKRVVQGAIEHADVPFARVVDAANVPRSTAYTPIFQTMMTLQGDAFGTRRVDTAAMSLADLEVSDMSVRPPQLQRCMRVGQADRWVAV